jgi:hypothetical protein
MNRKNSRTPDSIADNSVLFKLEQTLYRQLRSSRPSALPRIVTARRESQI